MMQPTSHTKTRREMLLSVKALQQPVYSIVTVICQPYCKNYEIVATKNEVVMRVIELDHIE